MRVKTFTIAHVPKDKANDELDVRPTRRRQDCRSEASLKRNRQLPFERNVDEMLNALKNEVAVDIHE
jgi:hypothetical protein